MTRFKWASDFNLEGGSSNCGPSRITRQRNRHRNLWDRQIGSVFPPGDLWIGLDTYMNCILIYDLLLKCVWCSVCHLFYLYRLMGKWVACGGLYEMFNIWATASTIDHLPGMFPPTDFPFEKPIEPVSMDLLYIIFTYHTQDNQQECFRFSNWFSLRCLGPLMNHLPPVWWSNFRYMFLNEIWCVRFDIVESNFLLMFTFYFWLYTLPNCYLYYSFHMVSLWTSFFLS